MSEIVNLRDVSRMPYKEARLSPKYKGFLGHVPADQQFTILLAGPSGTGKSTLCLQLAHEFSRLGRVLYVCAEERIKTGTIRLRARLLKISSQKILMHDTKSLTDVNRELDTGMYSFCFVDSIQEMDASDNDVRPLIDLYPSIVFVFVAQVDWTEKMSRGSSSWRHAVDIRLWTEMNEEDNSRWAVNIKNRYAPAQQKMFLFKGPMDDLESSASSTSTSSYKNVKMKMAEKGKRIWNTSKALRLQRVQRRAIVHLPRSGIRIGTDRSMQLTS